mmetsp:Transcript_2643/g.5059  ORF Transcript_2643/g.5059 Transcript_2643/m.5059 type:complete len:269 (-) Transcript_2643:48-854(-)|eukprot:CAMPEP_0178799638 /NCGR_PEP_ID=MMETSP0745-20121128/12403_1 /TAXON_ID=913974 /ORGANISM="Nitzschia punctata, Strain CCMP561" /LENGTH=268 /DNA_ID=CAMNT_0020458385 /DNA_START=32 /DNA_END=838 /DNA_ORIENTATION=+
MPYNKDEWQLPAPYGASGWCSLVVTTLAALFFFLSSFTCWFTVSEASDLKIYVGYWKREQVQVAEASALAGENKHYCVSWDSSTKDTLFDAPWKFAKAVTVFGSMVCIVVFLATIITIFLEIKNGPLFSCLVCTNILMAILSMLLLSGLGSDVCEVENCRLGPGGVLAILDSLLWAGSAVMAYRLKILSDAPVASQDDEEDRKPRTKPKARVSSKKASRNTDAVDHSISETENDDAATNRQTIKTPKSPKKKKKATKKVAKKKQMEEP